MCMPVNSGEKSQQQHPPMDMISEEMAHFRQESANEWQTIYEATSDTNIVMLTCQRRKRKKKRESKRSFDFFGVLV